MSEQIYFKQFSSVEVQFQWQKHFYSKQFSLASKNFHFKQFNLNVKIVLFQAIQLNISTQFSSIWPIDRIFSCATTPGQSVPESDGSEGYSAFPQSPSITRPSPSDCLVSYPGHLLQGFFYPSAEKQLVYSTAPADWASM